MDLQQYPFAVLCYKLLKRNQEEAASEREREMNENAAKGLIIAQEYILKQLQQGSTCVQLTVEVFDQVHIPTPWHKCRNANPLLHDVVEVLKRAGLKFDMSDGGERIVYTLIAPTPDMINP